MTDYTPTTEEVRTVFVSPNLYKHLETMSRDVKFTEGEASILRAAADALRERTPTATHNRKIAAEALREAADEIEANASDEWCRAENCRYRHWRSGPVPTHKHGGDCPDPADNARADRIEQGGQE